MLKKHKRDLNGDRRSYREREGNRAEEGEFCRVLVEMVFIWRKESLIQVPLLAPKST